MGAAGRVAPAGGAGAADARGAPADARPRPGPRGLAAPTRRRGARRHPRGRRLVRAAVPHQGRAARRLSVRPRLRRARARPARAHVLGHHRQPGRQPVHARRRGAVDHGDGALPRHGGRGPAGRGAGDAVVRPLHRRLRVPLRGRADRGDGGADRRRPHVLAAAAHARPRGHGAGRHLDLSAAPPRGGARGAVRSGLAPAPGGAAGLRDVVRRPARADRARARPHHLRHHRDDRDGRPRARHRLPGAGRHPRLGGPLLLRDRGPGHRAPARGRRAGGAGGEHAHPRRASADPLPDPRPDARAGPRAAAPAVAPTCAWTACTGAPTTW